VDTSTLVIIILIYYQCRCYTCLSGRSKWSFWNCGRWSTLCRRSLSRNPNRRATVSLRSVVSASCLRYCIHQSRTHQIESITSAKHRVGTTTIIIIIIIVIITITITAFVVAAAAAVDIIITIHCGERRRRRSNIYYIIILCKIRKLIVMIKNRTRTFFGLPTTREWRVKKYHVRSLRTTTAAGTDRRP